MVIASDETAVQVVTAAVELHAVAVARAADAFATRAVGYSRWWLLLPANVAT